MREDILNAIKDYTSGIKMKDVELKYNISNVTIYKYMKKLNINYKSQHGRIHSFSQNYFDIIDNEHKAYWLGYLYADGCISKINSYDKLPGRIKLNLSTEDRVIIETFLKDIKADTIKIKDYIPKGTYSTNSMSTASINSTSLCKGLLQHGVFPNKTNNLVFPWNSLQPNLYNHFIRGLFDGDGSIHENFTITSNKELLLDIQKILVINCNLNILELIPYKNKPKSFDLQYGGRLQLQRIFEYLYKDSTIHLQRKYDKFVWTISSPLT